MMRREKKISVATGLMNDEKRDLSKVLLMTVDHLRCTVDRLLSLKIGNVNIRTGSSACACDLQNKFSFGNDDQTACRLIVHLIFRNILAATRAWIRS